MRGTMINCNSQANNTTDRFSDYYQDVSVMMIDDGFETGAVFPYLRSSNGFRRLVHKLYQV